MGFLCGPKARTPRRSLSHGRPEANWGLVSWLRGSCPCHERGSSVIFLGFLLPKTLRAVLRLDQPSHGAPNTRNIFGTYFKWCPIVRPEENPIRGTAPRSEHSSNGLDRAAGQVCLCHREELLLKRRKA